MKILNLLINICKNRPNKIAISFLNKNLSYKDLYKGILNYYSFLKKNKLKKIIIIENEEEDEYCYLAFFACLMAKVTYIPISIKTPKLRIESIANNINPCVIISSKKIFSKNFINITPTDILNKKRVKTLNKKRTNIAYIIFTSGSTGLPKGVCISRKSLDHYVMWLIKSIFTKKNLRCPQFSRIGFDLSVVDIYGTLCSGNTLFPIVNEYDRLFINKFIYKHKINLWVSVPSAIEIFDFTQKKKLLSIKKYFFCGELLKKIYVKKIFNLNNKSIIYNTYGPTEATVSCSLIKINEKNFNNICNPTVSIGKPIKNMKFLLKGDKKKKEGELLISGIQLANGYIDKTLTKEKFITIKDKKYYKTGDICKIINKNYYFLGRVDNQIKINGYRVELDEIDTTINSFFKINSNSIVLNKKIYTFINKLVSEKKIIKILTKKLPLYMVPNKIIYLNHIPRNKNFKIDTNKLKLIIKNA